MRTHPARVPPQCLAAVTFAERRLRRVSASAANGADTVSFDAVLFLAVVVVNIKRAISAFSGYLAGIPPPFHSIICFHTVSVAQTLWLFRAARAILQRADVA